MVKIKTVKAILNMDDGVQRDILALGIPMATDYDDDNEDSPLPTVSSWSLDGKKGTVKVSYQHGFEYSLPMEEMLKTERLHLLEQLRDLAHSNDARSRVVMIFKYMLQKRRDDIMALYANAQHDDESEKSDEQSDWYISDVIPYTKDY
ncbi:hypothetical protein Hanom_Chr09g00833671 [Helianthus anomalus]